MGVAANIISAVLKSVVGDKIGNELASELIDISIDEASEKGIDKISDFINGEKSKIDRILSKENMKSMGIPEESIDYVVEEIKDLFSRINITDEVFRQCEYDSTKFSVFLWDEYHKDKGSYIECENGIKRCLFKIAQVLIELLRESEDFEKDFLIQISNSVDDNNVEIQKISEYLKDNFNKLDADNRIIFEILRMILEMNKEAGAESKDKKQKVKSRTQEYADKWNQNMFLNDFDKRDENAGINVKLGEVYLEKHLPHYIWEDNNKPSTDLKELLSEYINVKKDNKMLLILGQPGIGKSTLITWITANFNNRIEDILIYKFASDLKNMDWKNGTVLDRVLKKLRLQAADLNRKVLILDGFDEVNIENNRRKDILNSFYVDWICNKAIKNFLLIITCRVNYIKGFERVTCNHITLQPWNEIQIKSFCTIFQEKTKNSVSEGTIEKFLENKIIFGIPLVLYMTMALNISIEKEGSIVDIYDQIFSLDNSSIYDRCVKNKNFDEPHRISEIKTQLHNISEEMAFWIFENNPSEESIPRKEYKKILKDNKRGKYDFMIGNYFKEIRHSEGIDTEKLAFVHRSIFEYYVSDIIFKAMCKGTYEEIAGNIGTILKKGILSIQILEYVKFKINKSELKNKENIFMVVFQLMLKDGMIYYADKKYKDVLETELNIFYNMLELVHLWDVPFWKFDDSICNFLKHSTQRKANLEATNLSELDLRNSDLSGANLTRAYLINTNLNGSNLTCCAS